MVVHLSAGPLEGMVELQRFFTDRDQGKELSFTNTAFGAYLVSKGLSADNLNKVAENPDVNKDGKKVSLFDLTEELSFDKAAEAITNEEVGKQLHKL